MTDVGVSSNVEPLFASNHRLWLRAWGTTQTVALLVATNILVTSAGGIGSFLSSPGAGRAILLFVLLVVYHVVGLLGHSWILRRRWAILLFVPLGWAIVITGLSVNAAFSVFILGAILQGFIFLPFAWAMAALAIVIALLAMSVRVHGDPSTANYAVSRVGAVIVAGMMVGTVLLYIHRANQEAALRTRLLQQLDAAQRDLAERSRLAGVLEERQRFARDIHDTLAQGFSSIIKHLEAIQLSAPGSPAADDALATASPHLVHAQDVARASLADIRRLVWALRPAELTDAPLADAIERVAAQWSRAHDVKAACTMDRIPPLHPDADVIFLRATQEALSNVTRHANATSVSVSLRLVDELVLLTIEDNGAGFAYDDGADLQGMGLSGMRERVRPFGGHVLLESSVGEGTSVTVALPLAAIAHTEVAAETGQRA